MEPLKIGFLGGCINNQPGIAADDFYYSVFARLMTDVDNRISAGTYYTFDKMAEKSETFSTTNQLDFLCLWVRQFPLMPMHKPFIKYENKSGGISWAIHPAFLKSGHDWNQELTKYHTQNKYVYKRHLKFEGRDMNLLAGKVFGLHHWARAYINKQIETINQKAKSHGIKLLLISPQQCPSSFMGNDVCKAISKSIEQYCSRSGIPYINIINLGSDYYAKDNVHFNAECHHLLANTIYAKLKEMMPERFLVKELEKSAGVMRPTG